MEKISEQEKATRRRINESVIGTHAIEGLHLDVTTRSFLHRYEEGELTEEQLSAALEKYAMSLVAASRVAGAA